MYIISFEGKQGVFMARVKGFERNRYKEQYLFVNAQRNGIFEIKLGWKKNFLKKSGKRCIFIDKMGEFFVIYLL